MRPSFRVCRFPLGYVEATDLKILGAALNEPRLHLGVYVPPAIAAVTLLPLVYFWASGAVPSPAQIGLFIIALAALAFGFLDMLIRDVRHTFNHSINVRMLVLVAMIAETILLFSFTYLAVIRIAGEMTGLQTFLDAVYFTMTTLLTIGFGDIAAEGQLARGIVLTQMFFTILVLSASVRLLSTQVRVATEKARAHQASVTGNEGV